MILHCLSKFYRPLRLSGLPMFSNIYSCKLNSASVKHIKLTFVWPFNGGKKTIDAKVGDTLLDAVLDNDVDIDGFGACEGTLACSTCHLILPQTMYDALPDKPTEEEMDLLDIAMAVTDTSRLGCQVRITESMDGATIKIPEGIMDTRM